MKMNKIFLINIMKSNIILFIMFYNIYKDMYYIYKPTTVLCAKTFFNSIGNSKIPTVFILKKIFYR